MENKNIVDVKYMDMSPKTYYKINDEKLLKVLKNSVMQILNDK